MYEKAVTSDVSQERAGERRHRPSEITVFMESTIASQSLPAI